MVYQELLLWDEIAMAEAGRNAVAAHETLLVCVQKTSWWHSLWHLIRIHMHLVLDGNFIARVTVITT